MVCYPEACLIIFIPLPVLTSIKENGKTRKGTLQNREGFLWVWFVFCSMEAGPSTATCAYDVLCFGKVLLELVTGKIGISQSDDATSREWLEQTLPYISASDKELVTKILDPSLIVDEDLLEEVWAMAIVARSCLNPRPAKRPPMKYILGALESPLKVVREENSSGSSSRLRNNSSRRSWSATIFGSWRHSLSESAPMPGHFNGGFRQSGRMGSQSSGGNDFSSSRKRLSSEIFPEPITITDAERVGGHWENLMRGNYSSKKLSCEDGNNPQSANFGTL